MSIQAIAKTLAHLPVGSTITKAAHGTIPEIKYVSKGLHNGVPEFEKILKTDTALFKHHYYGTELGSIYEKNPKGLMSTVYGVNNGRDSLTQIILNDGREISRLSRNGRAGGLDTYIKDGIGCYEENSSLFGDLLRVFQSGFDKVSQVAQAVMKW